MELLSIIVASKNQAKYIPDFILGLKKQTFQNFEVIVVDSSDDESCEIFNSYNKIKIFKNKLNSNDAYLYGISQARGKYLMFGSTSDYLYSPKWIELAIKKLENNNSLSLVWTSGVDITENNDFLGIWAQHLIKRTPPSQLKYLSYWFYNFYLPELNYCVNREVYKFCLKNYKMESEVYEFTFIYSFLLNFTKQGFLLEYIPELGHAGRQHEDRMTVKDYLKTHQELQTLKKLKCNYLLSIIFFKNTHIFRDSNFNEISRLSKKQALMLPIQIMVTYVLEYFYLIIRKITRA